MNNYKIAIVVSMFNEKISNSLISGANKCYKDLTSYNLNDKYIYRVPGAFEIPFVVKKLLSDSHSFDAIVTLGCIIKGETAHFEYISNSVTDAIMNLNIDISFNIPILYGVLTTYNYEQALARAVNDKSNKGYEVMDAAIKMINLIDV
tara:strand:+ start:169 stop:612 length:444 start_codon:yes stop_codon:yes gene_type:complete